ncbi:MAG: 3' terminal RNA ribose 2'-O-methyltransferase Hen1 [Bacteroidota bacterium]
MLLTISTRHQPATDIGFLFHKHPDRFQSVELSLGIAHIFYPESTVEKCTIALLLDIDPIDMVRGKRNLSGKGFSLGQYVNDRPYVASSFMSVALSKAFASAMNGNCSQRPDLVDTPMPLEVTIAVLPAPRGGKMLIEQFFQPLGYQIELEQHALDPRFTDWGESKYFTVRLQHTITVQQLLSHLYVLIPAIDNDQHFFVSQNEIDKLLEKGKTWLMDHPAKEQIIKRYLINLGTLSRQAIEQLAQNQVAPTVAKANVHPEKERKVSLHQKRLQLVLKQLKLAGAKTVIDLGCGEGKLLRMLLKEKQFTKIVGMDVVYSELTKAKDRLYWEEMAPKQKERIQLFQGALTYRDQRLSGFDAAALVEVIAHLDEYRLKAFERVVFEFAQPKTIILTTPNSEYNVFFEGMETGTMRHSDHRFEWTRTEFEAWAKSVAERNNYQVNILPIGEEKDKVGAPSQMGIFTYGN